MLAKPAALIAAGIKLAALVDVLVEIVTTFAELQAVALANVSLILNVLLPVEKVYVELEVEIDVEPLFALLHSLK
jgi:hypothetical protein